MEIDIVFKGSRTVTAIENFDTFKTLNDLNQGDRIVNLGDTIINKGELISIFPINHYGQHSHRLQMIDGSEKEVEIKNINDIFDELNSHDDWVVISLGIINKQYIKSIVSL